MSKKWICMRVKEFVINYANGSLLGRFKFIKNGLMIPMFGCHTPRPFVPKRNKVICGYREVIYF